jgi:hypothetical protein
MMICTNKFSVIENHEMLFKVSAFDLCVETPSDSYYLPLIWTYLELKDIFLF